MLQWQALYKQNCNQPQVQQAATMIDNVAIMGLALAAREVRIFKGHLTVLIDQISM